MERLYNVIRNSLVLVSIVLDKDDNLRPARTSGQFR
jgi:hypothetical protein